MDVFLRLAAYVGVVLLVEAAVLLDCTCVRVDMPVSLKSWYATRRRGDVRICCFQDMCVSYEDVTSSRQSSDQLCKLIMILKYMGT